MSLSRPEIPILDYEKYFSSTIIPLLVSKIGTDTRSEVIVIADRWRNDIDSEETVEVETEPTSTEILTTNIPREALASTST